MNNSNICRAWTGFYFISFIVHPYFYICNLNKLKY